MDSLSYVPIVKMVFMKTLNILLATYNSEKYIREQLDSLLAQTYQNWRLVVRDDLSTDHTLDVVNEYVSRYPEKISILNNEGKSLRAYLNFYEMLSKVESDYYMFCDHDDVWVPNKIELSMARMKEVEREGIPVIVHTDMKVVDQNLNTLAESFWHYSKLLPEHTEFKELVLCNSVNGCTMLFNRKAREVALPHVGHTTMHDMLVTQSVAANGGIISPINEPTVLYRQHIDNVVGAHERNKNFYMKKLIKLRQTIKDNYQNWYLSQQISHYSYASYWWIKLKVTLWKIKKYK